MTLQYHLLIDMVFLIVAAFTLGHSIASNGKIDAIFFLFILFVWIVLTVVDIIKVGA